jgi:pimeloyl-ACP methyl ester carboxylesterase
MLESTLESRPQADVRMVEGSPASRPEPALAGFEHRFATVGGVRLHFVSGGKEDGDVVLLLAGFPESWYEWRKVMPLLAPTYKVIAPDLPGQGDSDRPAAGYDTKTLATTVHRLLEQLGTRNSRRHIAGCSADRSRAGMADLALRISCHPRPSRTAYDGPRA